MVVQSIVVPNVSGSSRDHEHAGEPEETAAPPGAAGRSFHARLLIPLLVATQVAWLGLLGYGVFRVLL